MNFTVENSCTGYTFNGPTSGSYVNIISGAITKRKIEGKYMIKINDNDLIIGNPIKLEYV